MSYSLTVDLHYGAGATGLTLVATFRNSDGSTNGGGSATFTERGGGDYEALLTVPDGFQGWVRLSSNAGATARGTLAINPAETENPDVRTSTRSSHTAADVWAVGTRTLSSFGTLVSDIWANATRTLSAFAFNVTVGTNTDKTGYSLTTAPPTAAAISTTVLDAALSEHTAAGSAGAALAAAGAAGDPWATALPSTYTSGQAGYLIGHNLDVPVSTRAGAGAGILTTGPVLTGGVIVLVPGDTYQTERGTALQWTYTGPVDLLTAPAPTVTLTISTPTPLVVDVTVGGTAGAITLTAELSAAQTAPLLRGATYRYRVTATWADTDTDRVTLVQGPVSAVRA